MRDILSWVNFVNVYAPRLNAETAFVHGASMVLLDSLGTGATSSEQGDRLKATRAKATRVSIRIISFRKTLRVTRYTCHYNVTLNSIFSLAIYCALLVQKPYWSIYIYLFIFFCRCSWPVFLTPSNALVRSSV